MIKAKEKAKGFASLTTMAHCFGLKRDAYYKYKSRADMRLKLEQQIIEIVNKRRRSLPREGVRKLKLSLDDEFNKANLKVVETPCSTSLENTICLRSERKPVAGPQTPIIVFISIITS